MAAIIPERFLKVGSDSFLRVDGETRRPAILAAE
jgi:hypothetical protein